MDSQDDKEVVQRFDELTAGGDLDRLDELCTLDMVNHALAPGRPSGIEGTRQFLATARSTGQVGRWLHPVVVAEGDLVPQFGVRETDWAAPAFR